MITIRRARFVCYGSLFLLLAQSINPLATCAALADSAEFGKAPSFAGVTPSQAPAAQLDLEIFDIVPLDDQENFLPAPRTGQSILFGMRYYNAGTQNFPPHRVECYVDGQLQYGVDIEFELSPNETLAVTTAAAQGPWTVNQPGMHTVEWRLISNSDQIPANNAFALPFYVAPAQPPAVDVGVATVYMEDAQGIYYFPRQGQPTLFSAIVYNYGSQPTAQIGFQVLVDGAMFRDSTIDAQIPAGGYATITTPETNPWPANQAGQHRVEVRFLVNGDQNPANNSLTMNFTVLGSGGVSPTQPPLFPTPTQPPLFPTPTPPSVPPRTASMPANLTAPPGGDVAVPVTLGDVTGITIAHAVFGFDESVLEFIGSSSPRCPENEYILSELEPGVIGMDMPADCFSSQTGPAEIVQLRFRVKPGIPAGTAAFVGFEDMYASSNAGTIDFNTQDGRVTVAGGVAPTPTFPVFPTPTLPPLFPTPTPTAPPVAAAWGDLNGDGVDGTVDASLILQWRVGLIDRFPVNPSIVAPAFPRNGDVNGDGQLGTVDASLILQKRVGLIDRYPAE